MSRKEGDDGDSDEGGSDSTGGDGDNQQRQHHDHIYKYKHFIHSPADPRGHMRLIRFVASTYSPAHRYRQQTVQGDHLSHCHRNECAGNDDEDIGHRSANTTHKTVPHPPHMASSPPITSAFWASVPAMQCDVRRQQS